MDNLQPLHPIKNYMADSVHRSSSANQIAVRICNGIHWKFHLHTNVNASIWLAEPLHTVGLV